MELISVIDINKKIKDILYDEGLQQKNLAKRLNTTQANLSAKLKRNNLSINEMEDIACALGYTLKIEFIKKEEKGT
jgi:transcriptional regulator